MQLTDDDFKRLDQMDKEANAKMNERDFIQRLLPHLVPNGTNENVRVDIYVAAAGHANRMIDVFENGNPAKILFTVPPLISPTPMTIRSIHARPETDIGELSAEYDAQVSTNAPGMVIDGFVNRLMALNYSPADAISAVYSLMWAKIYRRYNIPLERMFGEDAPEVARQLGQISGEAETDSTPVRKTLDEIEDDDIEPL
ncbi:hypothetical protein D3C73_209320 [compost metagenome]|jgi:hypothetical protein